MIQIFALFWLIRTTWAFVHSCDEIQYKLLNGEFPTNLTSKYLCVVTQEMFTSIEITDQIFAEHDNETMSFTSISKLDSNCISKPFDDRPWKIYAKSPSTIDCTEHFTLILTSGNIAPYILLPLYKSVKIPLTSRSANSVFVNPSAGVVMSFEDCEGHGNITLFTGAGSGEAEERYEIRSWTCETLPNRIFSLDSVITMQSNFNRVKYLLHVGNYVKPSAGWETTVGKDGYKIVLYSSGRSNTIQNRIGGQNGAYFLIKDEQIRNVTLDMNISFDPAHILNRIAVREHLGSKRTLFGNGRHKKSFISNNFSVAFDPDPSTEERGLWRSEDYFMVDIAIGGNDTISLPAIIMPASYTVSLAANYAFSIVFMIILFRCFAKAACTRRTMRLPSTPFISRVSDEQIIFATYRTEVTIVTCNHSQKE